MSTCVTRAISNVVEDDGPMGFSFQRRQRVGRNTSLNVSKSGVSASRRAGRVTVNSRGRISVNLGRGLRWRGKI
ncbi:DUF4236 domain-containing protein [Rudaeicoccus suwonensis]